MRVLFPNLVIPQAATKSNAIDGALLAWQESITVYAPLSLAGVTSMQVSPKSVSDSVDADYRTSQSGGSDIAIAAGKAVTISELSFGAFRLSTTVAPGAGGETYGLVGEEKPALIGY